VAKWILAPIPQGQACTAKLYEAGSDTVAETIGTLTEQTNRVGWARGVTALTGFYRVQVLIGANVVADGYCQIGATDATEYLVVEYAAAGAPEVTLAAGAISDASFTVPNPAAAVVGPVGMDQAVYRWFLKKSVKDSGANTITLYADDGVTPITTMTISDVGGVQTKGAAT